MNAAHNQSYVKLGRCVLLGGLAALLASCAVVDAVRKTPAAQFVGLGPDIPCDIDLAEQRRLIGAYLQSPTQSAGARGLFITGQTAWNNSGLPGNLAIEDKTVRQIRPAEDGVLEGWRSAVATPIAGLNSDGVALPRAYDLTYRAEGVDFAGALVVGPSPKQADLPMTGQVSLSGPVQVTVTRAGDGGAPLVTQAAGTFTMSVGYGSGRAQFSARGFQVSNGPALEFASLSWTNLGLCASRIVSSGQGSARLFAGDGARMSLFGPDADPAAGSQVFESSQFARSGDEAGPPNRLGGIFAIQADAITIEGVFLSEGAS